MSRAMQLSTEHHPILFLEIGVRYDEHDLAELKRELRTVFDRRQKFVLIVQTQSTSYLPDARMRQVVVDWWKSMLDDQKRWTVGTAIVVSSAPLRGALTAMSWLFTSPTPQTYTKTTNEALDWARERLREAGVPVTDALRTLRVAG